MSHTADVVIIGGGVVGASVAYHLAERGCTDVLILEREAAQGRGSTGRATGGVRAQFATEINVLMSRYSIDFFARFEEATGHACGYVPAGYLFVATSERQLAFLRAAHELQRAAGLANVELLGAEEVRRRLPHLRADDVAGGSFCPTDGFISPTDVMRGFTRRAVGRGARLWLDTSVTGVAVRGGGVVGVETTRGRVTTRAVVNAAGAWAAGVARLAGEELPVTPLRRQLVDTRPFAALPEDSPMVVDVSDGFHFRPVAGAAGGAPCWRMGWPDPRETPGFKTDFEPDFAERLMRRAAERVPCLAGAEVDLPRCRAGLYEMTPDHHPVVGESAHVRGLFFANGFSGHGVMHSPATGRLVSEFILDGRAGLLDASPLSPERFAAGRLLEATSLL